MIQTEKEKEIWKLEIKWWKRKNNKIKLDRRVNLSRGKRQKMYWVGGRKHKEREGNGKKERKKKK